MSETVEPVTGDAPIDPVIPATDPANPEDVVIDPDLGAKKAILAERKARRDAETALAELQAKLADPDKPVDKSAIDAAARDAADAATKAADARYIRSELRAAAKGVMADPSDALMFIDTSAFKLDKNGDLDPDALNDAISALLVLKPHLAAVDPARFKGGADGGPAAPPKPADSANERAAAALAAGDVKGSIALKLTQLKPVTP